MSATTTAVSLTSTDTTVIVGALRNAVITQSTLVEHEGNFVIAEMEFQAQRLDGRWINVVSLLRLGQMAPDFASAEPRVLVGSMRLDRWFEAKGVFELTSGEVAIG
ncbi:hypothetical protein GCM10025867_46230 (plasmid) [Frondihabitans sucicola]|uniref:YceI family protein n=1 Tax=Frondihabitans sucicola TaxID=1268041 RepID=A0ABM8GV89_9MICO|nr:hypothetical protein [Frondihabitans sucicola]BDZ52382.1 hypothetical protein GCM10025867_46230 [Frondihabitans sucicola]